jgi:hypothetical protein
MIDRSRYRYVNFVAGRVLESREMAQLQDISRGVDMTTLTASAFDLNAIYNDGALFNATLSISGKTVQLVPVVSNAPMRIFVRGRWETLKAGECPQVTLGAGQTALYLFYYLAQITSGATDSDTTDSELVTAAGGEATADMGELRVMITADSGFAPPVTALEHYGPITLYTFTQTSNSLTIASQLSNVQSEALADNVHAGPVLLSTGTASGIAVANDDPRLSDARTPADGTVTDVKVRTPIATSGSTYDLTQDPGGIDSAKVVHQRSHELLADIVDSVRSELAADETELAQHINHPLGTATTHPFPTYDQVGATPASHMTQNLGQAHAPIINTQKGGLEVVRTGAAAAPANPPIPDDCAEMVIQDGNVIAGLLHNGDVYSKPASTFSATSGVPNQPTAALGFMSLIAQLLAQHTNDVGTGAPSNTNPHGLSAGDLGAATTGYVDNAVSQILAAANTYTDSKTGISVRKKVTVPRTQVQVSQGGESYRVNSYVVSFFEWLIIGIGPSFELGLGVGVLPDGASITLPNETGWSGYNCIGTAGMSNYLDKNDLNSPAWQQSVASFQQNDDGNEGLYPSTLWCKNISSQGSGVPTSYGSTFAFAWRFK